MPEPDPPSSIWLFNSNPSQQITARRLLCSLPKHTSMMMTTPFPFHLDWQNFRKRNKAHASVMSEIDDAASDSDISSWMVEIVSTRADEKLALIRVDERGTPDRDGAHQMIVRDSSLDRYRKKSKKEKQYWVQWFLKAHACLVYAAQKVPGVQSHVEYDFSGIDSSAAHVDDLIHNIALRTGIYQPMFSCRDQKYGQVHLTAGFEMELDYVFDLWSYYAEDYDEEQGIATKQFSAGPLVPREIPDMPLTIRWTSGLPKAVVISAQEDFLDDIRPYTAGCHGLDQVIFIETGEYPSIGTRMLASLLSKDKQLVEKDVPFIFVSDCALNNMQIYLALKKGFESTTFLPPQMTCPKLQWLSPRRIDIEQCIEQRAIRYADSQKVFHKKVYLEDWTGEDYEIFQRHEKGSLTHRLKKYERAPAIEVEQSDKEMFERWEKDGLLEDEPNLKAEIELLKSGKDGYTLGLIMGLAPYCFEDFLALVVEEVLTSRHCDMS